MQRDGPLLGRIRVNKKRGGGGGEWHGNWKYSHGMTIAKGAQWLSGRVLDSRPKGRGFEPHRRHCVVVLEQDTFILA